MMEGYNMKRRLRLKAVLIPPDKCLVSVVEQTHFDKDFSGIGNMFQSRRGNLAVASHGSYISGFPRDTLWLCSTPTDLGRSTFIMEASKLGYVKSIIKEYNEYYK